MNTRNFTKTCFLSLLFLLGTIPLLQAQTQTHTSPDKAVVINSFPSYHQLRPGSATGGSASGMGGLCHTLACCSVWVYRIDIPAAGSIRMENLNFTPLAGSIIAYKATKKNPTSFSDLTYASGHPGNFCGFRDSLQLGYSYTWSHHNRTAAQNAKKTVGWRPFINSSAVKDTIGPGSYYILAWSKNNQINFGTDTATFVFRYQPYCGGTTGRTCPPTVDINSNDVSIGNGNATFSKDNNTLLDSVSIYGSKTITYAIENSLDSFFTLDGTNPVSISGPGASFFSVASQPSDRSIDNDDSTTFQIKYSPTNIGSDTAVVKIANSVNDTFTFTIVGNSLDLRPIAFAQKFEGTTIDNWTYTPDPVAYATETDSVIAGSEDIWDIIRELTGDIDDPFDGRYFWGTQDLKNSNGGRGSAHHLNFDNVYVGNLSNSKLKFNYYSDGFDSNDSLFYELFLDDVGQGKVFLEKNSDAWLTVRMDIPATADSVKFRWSAYNDGASDYSGFDGLEIRGTAAPSGSPEISVVFAGTEITSGDNSPSTIENTDFGSHSINAAALKHTFYVKNGGTASLSLTGSKVSISGTNASDFTVSTQPSASIATGDSSKIEISFAPGAAGARTATVSIANTDSDENPYTFAIQGTGTAPEIKVSANSTEIVDGSTTVSTSNGTEFSSVSTSSGSASVTYTIENTGLASLTLSGSPVVSISGTHASDFSVTQPSSSTIAASGSVTFSISFDPSADGTRTASISIANDDSDENPYTFNIQGEGLAATPIIKVFGSGTQIVNGQTTTGSTDNTDFGSVSTMGTDSVRFMVTNPGNQYLSFNQFPRITITGTHASDFENATDIGGVSPGDTGYFYIRFSPSDTGLRTATLSWKTNISSAQDDTFSFNVSGTGSCPVINPTTMDVYATLSPTLYNGDTASTAKKTTLDAASAGNTSSRTFYIKNTGSTNNLVLANATVTGLYSVFSITSAPSASVSPGDSTALTVEFTPFTQGIYSGEVSFSSNTCPDSIFRFTIQATAACNNSGTQWTQVGSTVYETEGAGYFGSEVDLSEDGQRMVVGTPSYNNSTTKQQGYGQMLEYDQNSKTWKTLGKPTSSLSIDSTGTIVRSNRDGTSIAISGNGKRMAVGGRDHRYFVNDDALYGYMVGGVIVYEYDANQDSMVQVGQRLYGTDGSRFGWDVELSKDGNTLLVGAQYGDSLFNNSGYIRIYDLSNSKWVLRGEAISGVAQSDEFGTSVAISDDGNTVAAGADYNDDNAGTSGHVRIFNWSGTAWVQKGSTLKGLYGGDRAGSSVSLSADGSIVAFGEKYHDLNDQIESGDPGKARVYEFKNSDWSQMGSSITGTFDGNKNDDEIGTSVALSSSGTRLVVGAPNRYGLGVAKVFDFKNGDWTQVGCELLGDENGDDFGYDVAISGDGSTILVGNEMSSSNDSAYVKVFFYDDAPKLTMSADNHVTCKGLANGSASATVADGVAPFTYSWSNGDTTLSTDSLVAGTYTFRVIDAAQDTVMDSVVITEPDSFKVQIASISNLLCNSDSSGVLNASGGYGSSGSGTFEESFDSLGKLPTGWSSYNNISSVAANAFWKVGAVSGSPNYGMQGTTDNTGNSGYYVWVDGSSPYPGEVSLETPMVANTSAFNFWMKRNTTGQPVTKYNDFTIDVYDGTTWHDSIFYHDTMTTSGDWEEFSIDISSYLNGDSVKVRLNVDKVALSSPFYDDITIDDVSFGGTNVNYTWTLGGTTVGNEATLSNIPAGTYKVIATTDAGCSDSTTATVTEPAVLVSTPTVDGITCYGLNDGAASIGLTGGTTPFNFTWSHAAINNDSISGLGVDTFSVLVTDSNGCTVRDTVILSQPDSLNAMASVDSNVTCNGLMNGKASLTVNGGTGTYTYAWNNAATSASLSSVPAGTYEVAVTDANGCVDSSGVTITEPAALLAGVLTGDTSVCSGTAPGKITQTTAVSGGVGNYSYQWQSSSDSSNWTIVAGATSIDYQPLAVAGNTWYRRLDRDSNSCGPDTTNAIKIGIYAQPNTGFTATTACEGQQTNFTDTTSLAFGSIKSYSWSFGDKGTSNQQNPINVYKNSGAYTVTLSVIADGGCNSTITKTVSVNAMPSVDFSATAACEGTATAFTNKASIATGNMTYDWNLGDNNSSTTAAPNHNYANAGYYTVQLIATSDSGCVDSISKTVQVKNVPKPNFSATAICEGNFTNFTNLTVGGSTYSWDFADGTGGSKQANPKNKYKNSGNYTVVLTATSTDGCSDTAQRLVNVYSLPTSSFTASEECLGTATDFTNNSSGASSYQWIFGDGTSSNNASPSVVYAKDGNYKVELTATTSNGCTDVSSTTIKVNALPVVSFTTADICLSENLTTTNNTTGAASYAWNFGDGNSSIATAPSHTYSAFGNYRLNLVATSSKGCIDSAATTVNAFAVPEVSFTATDVCFGTSTDFSNSSKIADGTMTYVWDLGDGSTTGNPSPSYGYAAAGAYGIKLVATSNNGCKDSTTGSVDVYAMPAVDFTTASVCYGDTLFTNNTSSVASYNWSFGDGNTSSDASPFNFYSTSGDYSVQLIATTTNNCIDSLSKNISIYSKPVADFDVKDVCDEEAMQFANGSYNAIITGNSWDFGDGNADNRVNPANTYSTDGSYTTTLIVTSNEGCEDTLSKVVTVHPNPVMAFANTTECDYDSTDFTNGSTIGSGSIGYDWDFGTGDLSNTESPTYQFAAAGAYKVSLTGTSDQGCVRTTEAIVVVNPSPQAAMSFDNNCEGLSSEFASTSSLSAGSIAGYEWDLGDGNASSLEKPSHLYALDGSYTVELVVTTDEACTDTTTSTIVVYNKPTASFNSPDICFGQVSDFTDASVDANDYLYDFGDKWGISTNAAPEYTYEAPGSYDATLFVTSTNGCKDTVTETIVIYSLPTAQFNINHHCLLEDFTPEDKSAGDISDWDWTYGDGNNASGIDPIYTYAEDGSYIVKLEVTDDNGCIDSLTKTVTVWPLPVVGIRTDTLVSKGYTVPMMATGGVEYKWSPIENLDKPLQANPSATVLEDVTYTVTIANEFGCTKDTFATLRVEEDYTLEPSNIMTPDGNGQNDNWIVEKAQYYNDVEVIVFDRWGRIVYQSSSYNNSWAGTSATGDPLPDGAYYYVVKVPTDREEYKGSITIFR